MPEKQVELPLHSNEILPWDGMFAWRTEGNYLGNTRSLLTEGKICWIVGRSLPPTSTKNQFFPSSMDKASNTPFIVLVSFGNCISITSLTKDCNSVPTFKICPGCPISTFLNFTPFDSIDLNSFS